MIYPLAIVTDGLLTLRGINTGAIATEGYLSPDAVVIADEGGFIGEWLPLPVPARLQPAPPPKRKAKVRVAGPAPKAYAHARNLPRRHARAVLIVHDGPMAEVVCRVDMTAVHEEETILAALAALL